MRTHQDDVINNVNNAVIGFDVGSYYGGVVDFKCII
jgi:hypothetical protein